MVSGPTRLTLRHAHASINAVAGKADSPVIDMANDSRDLFVFQTGRQLFAVPASDVAGTAERKVSARLPFAPAAILGVISWQGRMSTVIDPLAFTNQRVSEPPQEIPLVVIIRGDEQLALAADRREDTLTVRAGEIRSRESSDSLAKAASAIAGSVQRADREVLVLDPQKLFAAAMSRSERRRRRS